MYNDGLLTSAEFEAAKQRVRPVLTQTLIPTLALTPPVILTQTPIVTLTLTLTRSSSAAPRRATATPPVSR